MKRIVDQHQGSLFFTNRSEGGLRAQINLPFQTKRLKS